MVIHWMRNEALHATTVVKLTDEWKVDRQSQDVVYVQMDHSRMQSFVSQNSQTGERSLVGNFQERFFDRFPDDRERMIRGGEWERQFRQDEQTMVDMGIPALDALERTNRSGTLASDGGAVHIFEPVAPNITFGSGSSELELTPLGKSELKSLRDKMVLLPDQNITIEGHTDNVGSNAANLSLSQRRADAAKDYVVGLGGVDAGRIATRGYGESRPKADNSTPEGRQQNRRIEITPR